MGFKPFWNSCQRVHELKAKTDQGVSNECSLFGLDGSMSKKHMLQATYVT